MRKYRIKRLLWLLCVLAAAAALFGCTEKEVTMAMGETIAVEGHCEITHENVLITTQVYDHVTKGSSSGYEAKEGRTYVVICAHVKNTSEEELNLQEICDFQLQRGEETDSGTKLLALKEGGAALDTSAVLEAGQSRDVYFVAETAEDAVTFEDAGEDNVLAAFDFRQDSEKEPVYNYKLAVDLGKPVAVYDTLNLKKTITAKGLAELTPVKVRMTKKIEPENPGYFYKYYKAVGEKDKLLVLSVTVKNLSEEKLDADEFYGIRVIGADGESYVGGVVADDEDKANITDSRTLEKKASCTTYAIANLPQEAQEGRCDIYLYVDGKYYLYNYEK